MKHGLVAGNDQLCPAGPRALENTIVSLIPQHIDSAPGPNYSCQVRQEYGHACKFVRVSSELACQYSQKLVYDGFGYDELVFFNVLMERSVCPTARQYERRDKDIGVEDDPQSLRYLRKSFSVRMPFSRALVLQ